MRNEGSGLRLAEKREVEKGLILIQGRLGCVSSDVYAWYAAMLSDEVCTVKCVMFRHAFDIYSPRRLLTSV